MSMIKSYETRMGAEYENNHRSLKRQRLIYYLRVYENTSKGYFGRVVDMSEQGLMLVLNKQVDSAARFNIVVEMPEDIQDGENLQLSVVSKWCNQDVNKDYFIAGFSFEELTRVALSRILKLLEEYAFSLSLDEPESSMDPLR